MSVLTLCSRCVDEVLYANMYAWLLMIQSFIYRKYSKQTFGIALYKSSLFLLILVVVVVNV